MTYRPYPRPDRARHQLDRHVHFRPAASPALAALREWSLTTEEAMANAATIARISLSAPSDTPGSGT